jgi:hypothetical protein
MHVSTITIQSAHRKASLEEYDQELLGTVFALRSVTEDTIEADMFLLQETW